MCRGYAILFLELKQDNQKGGYMTEQEQREKLEKAICTMQNDPDIQDTVKRIEGSVMTTQGHYGRYMAVLSPFAGDRTCLFVVYKAMQRLGANQQGLQSALQIIVEG